MAKTMKPQRKLSVSTKAMFGKAGEDAPRAVKIANRKASKVLKSSKHGKARRSPTPEHPLSAAFSDSIELAREQIYTNAVANYEAAYIGLSQQLMAIDHEYVTEEQELIEQFEKINIPFKDEEVEFSSADGKQTGVVTLSHRMKKVKKVIDAEEAELHRQYNEWLAVEAEIDRLAAEYAAPPTQTGTDVPADIVGADYAEMMQEIEAEKANFEKLMEQGAQASIREMQEGEADMRLKRKEMEHMFYNMLAEEEF